MKRIIILAVLMLLALLAFGEQIGTIPELLRPNMLDVSGDKFYVVEGTSAMIYSLSDCKLIKKFGKTGEGPGEIPDVKHYPAKVIALHNSLFMEGSNKVLNFGKDGAYKSEIRKKGPILGIVPVGDRYIGIHITQGEDKKIYFALGLYDAELNLQNDIAKALAAQQGRVVSMIPDALNYSVYKDKIFVEKSTEGFAIEVYDKDGKKLYDIKGKSEPIKVTEDTKKAFIDYFEQDTLAKTQGGYKNIKKVITFTFPETLPLIRSLVVENDKIYVRTFNEKDSKNEFIIMDLKGNNRKTVYLPKAKEGEFFNLLAGRDMRFFDFQGDNYYYLIENEEDEEYELHVEKVK